MLKAEVFGCIHTYSYSYIYGNEREFQAPGRIFDMKKFLKNSIDCWKPACILCWIRKLEILKL